MSNKKNLKGDRNLSENKGDENMDATLNTAYKRLNISALNFSSKEISTEESLKDSTPIQWAKEILSGERDVIIKNNTKKEESNMVLGNTIESKNNSFNDFLKANVLKINLAVPKNPSIKKDDEWRNEDLWDDKE